MRANADKTPGSQELADSIDDLLPQTQCRRCGYASCREYAAALAAGQSELNRCPPGGDTTITALARVLHCEPKPLNPACGHEGPWVVARIDEGACIGCTLCIRACPVDAILGAAKRMHTVIESECTGCELCLDPCPVDCIMLEPMQLCAANDSGRASDGAGAPSIALARWMHSRAAHARERFLARRERLSRLRRARAECRRAKRASLPGRDADRATKQAAIRAAVHRVRHRRSVHDC